MTGETLVGDFSTIEEFISLIFEAKWEEKEVLDNVSPKMSALIQACVVSDHEKRIQNGRELSEYLAREFPDVTNDVGYSASKKPPLSNKAVRPQKAVRQGKGPARGKGPAKKTARTAGKTGKNAAILSDSQELVQKSSVKKIRLIGILTCSFMLFLFLYIIGTGNVANKDSVVALTEIASKTREWMVFPKGFYIFFQGDVGKNLRWEFKAEASKGSEAINESDYFKKVAGGWKALCSPLVVHPERSGILSIFDGQRLIALGPMGFPKKLLDVPLKVVFSYDSIQCSWKFSGVMRASLLFESLKYDGTVINSFEVSELDSKYRISLKELGFSGHMRVTLMIPGISKTGDVYSLGGDLKVAFDEGHSDFTLKCQLPLVEGRKYSGYQFFYNKDRGIRSQADIATVVVVGDRVFVSTESAQLHCLQIDHRNGAFYKHLWSKNLYTSLYGKLGRKKKKQFKINMSPGGMVKNGDGVSLFGLDYRSLMYSFDKNGKYSTSRIPFPGGAIPYLPVKMAIEGDSRLLACHRYKKGNRFYLWQGDGSCRLVDVTAAKGEFSEVYGALGTFFFWYEESNSENIYYIDRSQDGPVMKLLGTYPSMKKLNDVYFASEDGKDHALFSLRDSLYLVRKKSGQIVPEEVSLKLPDRSGIGGIVSNGGGKYLCAFYAGLSRSTLVPTSMPTLNVLDVFVSGNDVRTLRGGSNFQVQGEAHRCSIVPPVLIDDDRFCFGAGSSFYVLSREDSSLLYSSTFYSSVRDIYAAPGVVLVEANTDGLLYGLNLPVTP